VSEVVVTVAVYEPAPGFTTPANVTATLSPAAIDRPPKR
jgi:hypothetical protein